MALKNIETCAAERRRFVLVVDGSERGLKLITSLLKRFEYEVCPVGTVKDALEIGGTVSPVLIVAARKLDGENDALGFLRAFKEANPFCTSPFIVLLAKPDPEFERDCLTAGAAVCLRAPVTIENFYRIIQVAIEPVPRMNIRISADLPAAIEGARKDETVRAISENGAFVATTTLRPLKTRMPIKIKLPDSIVSADAEVIYSKAAGDDRKGQSGLGLQFVKISDEDQKRIRMFIRSEMSRGIAPLPPGK